MDALTPVELPEDVANRLRVYVGAGALVWCAIYGWFSFVRDTDVPVLFLMQLAVHELGHRVFAPFGDYTMVLMGSGSEILAPLLLGIVVLAWKRNPIGAGACWAVAAAACQHTSMYMADAPRGEMMLIGGDESDWLRIFDGYWDALYKADIYAARMRTVGIVIWFAAVGVVAAGMVLHHRKATAAERAARVRPTATPSAPVRPVAGDEMWR